MSEHLRQLQALAAEPAAVAWFKGLFSEAHLEFTDSGERFTIRHLGDRAAVLEGFERPDANLVIPMRGENLANLTAIFADGDVSAAEEYRIVRHMLRPCIEAAVKMPILNNEMLLKVLRVDDVWQQALVDPEGEEDVRMTVQKTGGRWTVTPGYHGTPRRRLRLAAPQLLDFQRRLFEADSENSIGGWVALARWYVDWRDQVTVPVPS